MRVSMNFSRDSRERRAPQIARSSQIEVSLPRY